jgi:cellulose biosynthesis protein BcsQ
MIQKTVHFNEAIGNTIKLLSNTQFDTPSLVIRDIQGRIRLAFDCDKADALPLDDEFLNELRGGLGAFHVKDCLLYRDDFFDPDSIFKSPSIVSFQLLNSDTPPIKLLDRQITGQDWAGTSSFNDAHPPRLVFFGLKGGVGRSTALTMLAYHLARQGKKVLLIDLDLESPGLSGLLLPQEQVADYGVVDWLIEDAVGQGDIVLRDMVANSPLSDNLRAEIRVVSAAGQGEQFYLDKLSRTYGDIPSSHGVEHVSERIQRLVRNLEEKEQPDVVLIDSRAGLHDLAAISIVELASAALLFATDTEQSWQGYRLLFKYWQSRPAVARNIRDRLNIVDSLFPERNQAERAERFLEKAYDIFSETLYDDVKPNQNEEDVFNFSLEDDSAPHFPLRINWDSRFQEFNPLDMSSGLFTEAQIMASFGNFLERAMQLIAGATNE